MRASEDEDSDDLPAPAGTVELYRHQWETDELAAEVRGILAAIDVPPANDQVMFEFQKTCTAVACSRRMAAAGSSLACRCILELEGNADAFRQPFVSAVLSAACSKEFAYRGLELVAAFDEIRLVDIMQTMKSLEFFLQKDVVSDLSTIVRNKLRRILAPPAPQPEPAPKPSKRERIAAERKVRATATARIVERKIELGRKLVTLRDATPSNQFGHIVRNQFGLDDPNSVTEMIRVVKLYGDRPEIFRNLSWHALTELASSATSQTQRRKFEARISASASPAPR